ncbi:MAG: PH domain-containing protein [Eggerthellaceae bacterium]|jgi:membrane protein YdbS with pleckstrin-like domain|nr:PH domain-containing protein [Eggerthellaceae bacterium]
MKEPPSEHLDPRIKSVWRINDALSVALLAIVFIVPFALVGVLADDASWAFIVVLAEVVAAIVALVLVVAVVPPIRYARWRYELSPEYLDIACGIIWRKRYVIPFIRVQNTDTQQGPILRAFGLSSVTVATAAGDHHIPGVDNATAELLRDKAAELARLAREDV